MSNANSATTASGANSAVVLGLFSTPRLSLTPDDPDGPYT
jgi:hypothetical protein